MDIIVKYFIIFNLIIVTKCSVSFNEVSISDGVPDRILNLLTLRFQQGIYYHDFKDYPITEYKDVFYSKYFDPSKPLMFYFHGWGESVEEESCQTLISAHCIKQEYNIFIFNYEYLVQGDSYSLELSTPEKDKDIEFRSQFVSGVLNLYCYEQSVENGTYIGRAIGNILSNFIYNGIDPKNIRLMTHSLGSHLGAHAARRVYNVTGEKIGWLTALDPSGPVNFTASYKMDSQVADFVDVVHTDGWLGDLTPVGHVDFYVNIDLADQPGCLPVFLETNSLFWLRVCSHRRSWHYYVESMFDPNAFIGRKCSSSLLWVLKLCDNNPTGVMGYAVSKQARGVYFLMTNNAYPYGLGINGSRYDNTFR